MMACDDESELCVYEQRTERDRLALPPGFFGRQKSPEVTTNDRSRNLQGLRDSLRKSEGIDCKFNVSNVSKGALGDARFSKRC